MKRFARRIALFVIAGTLATVASMLSPASGAFTNACTGGQIWSTDQAQTRTCAATGRFTYVAATPNPWTITVKRGSVTVMTVRSSAVNTTGTLPTANGDSINVTVSSVCSWAGCANGGVFVFGDQL